MTLTALQNLPQETIWWIAGVIGFLIIAFLLWRYQVHARLTRLYDNSRYSLQSALEASEPTYKQLTDNPAGIVLQAPEFSGKTKTEYDRVRLTWLNWINLRAFAEERRSRAKTLFDKHQNRPWWQCFFCCNLKRAVDVLLTEPLSGTCQSLSGLAAVSTLASADGTSASLPGRITNERSAVAASFETFSRTIADAASACREVAQEFTNTTDDDKAGIDHLSSKLLKAGLALSPYEERLAETTRLKDEQLQQLEKDPVGATGQMMTAFKQKVGMLRRSLLDAIQYKAELEALRARHQKVSEDASAMLRRKPRSGIEGVKFSVRHSLDEPGFELPPLIKEAGEQLLELDTLLLDGHLVKFGRAIQPIDKSVGRAEKLFAAIGEDKERADSGFAEIKALSSPTDLTHDEPEHQSVRELYAAQKWNAAAGAVNSLLQTCQNRAGVRRAHAQLSAPLSELSGLIRNLSAVVSQRLEDRLGVLESQAGDLGRRCHLPNPDCAILNQAIAALGEQLTGAADSLQSALDAELAVHAQVTSGLTALVERMTDVTSRVADNWGGSLAAEKLAGVQPLLGPIVADGKARKPDWQRLFERINETLALVEPVRVLVYAEVNRNELLTASVEAADRFVRSLSNQHYKRVISGVIFGAGLYCPSGGLAELVDKAREDLGRRLYEEVALQLRTLQVKVGREHLECCWMLLQSMAHTTESSTVRFAHENGYCDGMFETWAAERLNLDEEGFHLFQLPEVTFRADRSLSLNAVVSVPAFDQPVSTDYEPAYVA